MYTLGDVSFPTIIARRPALVLPGLVFVAVTLLASAALAQEKKPTTADYFRAHAKEVEEHGMPRFPGLADFIRSTYTKFETMIPMRDGVHLHTALYVPKDAGTDKRYPIILFRTPYSVPPYGPDTYPNDGGFVFGPPQSLIREKFIFALQDVRGCMSSEGEFVDDRPYRPNKGPKETDESSDAYDTVDWLVKNVPNNNGKVGTWGLSYPGFYALMAAVDAHPALAAASPQGMSAGDHFPASLGERMKTPLPAMLLVGGWFDPGAITTFRMLEAIPQADNRLVMGPWGHGDWAWLSNVRLGDLAFAPEYSEYYRQQIERPFFVYHLKGGPDPKQPKAWAFETGTNRWRSFDFWPPRAAQPVDYHLAAGGALATTGPAINEAVFDEYVSDPSKPVPSTLRVDRGGPTEDQRYAATRPDVLVYQTGALEADVTVAGPVVVDLFVASTDASPDWVVKLIDVYSDDYPLLPDEIDPELPTFLQPKCSRLCGYQQLVRGEQSLAEDRKRPDKPGATAPGEAETLELAMLDVFHTFRRGHRIMIQVQSTWSGLEWVRPAGSGKTARSTQRVYRDAAHPSHLRLLVLR